MQIYLQQVPLPSNKALSRSFPLIRCQTNLPACIAIEHLCQDLDDLKFIALSKGHITSQDENTHHNYIGNPNVQHAIDNRDKNLHVSSNPCPKFHAQCSVFSSMKWTKIANCTNGRLIDPGHPFYVIMNLLF